MTKISRPDTRTTAAWVTRRHGAWFIQWTETASHDGESTPEMLFDCSSSHRGAKRVARQGAEELGWTGPFTWMTDPDSAGLLLLATDDDGYERDDEVDDDG